MAEGEDVIVDAARHATVFVRHLWRQRRASDSPQPRELALRDIAPRLELLVTAALGVSHAIRPAQSPARPTFLQTVFRRGRGPTATGALPSTDGSTLWLPPSVPLDSLESASATYRLLALRQALRAQRGAPAYLGIGGDASRHDVFLVLEAAAADHALAAMLPGLSDALVRFRHACRERRPALERFPPHLRVVEHWVRTVFEGDAAAPVVPASSEQVWEASGEVVARLRAGMGSGRGTWRIFKDAWTGELRSPASDVRVGAFAAQDIAASATGRPPRSAHMTRRPRVREAVEDEDDRKPGAWMVQTTQPHEHVEDGFGMQRPTDRDETTAAEEFADSLSELPEARLVTTPGRPKEILLSDDPPPARARAAVSMDSGGAKLVYPEWDWRIAAYRQPGAIVHLLDCELGPERWVQSTLAAHAGVLQQIRRRFEMLRADRMVLRRRLDGDEIDLSACVDARVDFRAGLPLNQAVYLERRAVRRDTAIVLLVDASGSTDAWVTADKRIVDVEREALLLVSTALDGANAPYAVLSFSGEGPGRVAIQSIKAFDERYGIETARRIAALEPQHYTRAGAALRHAAALLMRQSARHRLLLLLSDGKPNDIDEYEGRYGVEDMRQAVTEVKLQGIFPFCLTIDRQAASYLPSVFGAHQYALLTTPERLPAVLLDWMRRLLATC